MLTRRFIKRVGVMLCLILTLSLTAIRPAHAKVTSPWIGLYINGVYTTVYQSDVWQGRNSQTGSGWQTADFRMYYYDMRNNYRGVYGSAYFYHEFTKWLPMPGGGSTPVTMAESKSKETARQTKRDPSGSNLLGYSWGSEPGVRNLTVYTRVCVDKILAVDPCTTWWHTTGY